jgi:serine/threonine protein kinase
VTRIPVPIVQYAEYGNLSDYQRQHLLDFDQKGRILLDIATALDFLHKCDIVHGDVKSENILLFENRPSGILAKLSDFGSSLPGGQGVFDFIKPGTRLWAAPEILDQTVQRQYRHQCDVFSYGLTAWRVAMDGEDPLSKYMLSTGVSNTDFAVGSSDLERPTDSEVVQIYVEDVLPGKAEVSLLVEKYVYLRLHRVRHSSTGSQTSRNLDNIRSQLGLQFETTLQHPPIIRFMTSLKSVINNTLCRRPEERNLTTALQQLMELNGRDAK